ncbi:unnamed protein product, partial [Lepidochelys kempii]
DEDKKSTEKKREEKAKKKHDRKAKKDEDEEDEGGEWEKVKGGAPLVKEKPKMFAKGTEINHAVGGEEAQRDPAGPREEGHGP